MKRLLTILLISLSLTSCYEIKSDDAHQTFEYWAGTKPPEDIVLIEGKYWQSAHWTREYIMYLKFKSTDAWWNEFLEQNFIPEDKDEWTKPDDSPNWFKPSDNSIRYGIKDDLDLGSRYFRDTLTGISYIYEIQF